MVAISKHSCVPSHLQHPPHLNNKSRFSECHISTVAVARALQTRTSFAWFLSKSPRVTPFCKTKKRRRAEYSSGSALSLHGEQVLKCRDDTSARSCWPHRCVGSPSRASTFAASLQNDPVFVIIGQIDGSGSPPGKRHPPRPHICPENVRNPGDEPPPSGAGLACVPFFHPSLSSWTKAARRNALSLMAMVQFRGFKGRDFWQGCDISTDVDGIV